MRRWMGMGTMDEKDEGGYLLSTIYDRKQGSSKQQQGGGEGVNYRLVGRGSCSGEVAAVTDVVQGPDGRVVGDSCEGVSCV